MRTTARKRIAATLHLAVPAPPSRTGSRALVEDSDARAAAVTAGRVLAAAGPLPSDVLVAAVTRSRRFRRDLPDPDALAGALTALRLATPDPDGGTWRATAAARAPARYRAAAAAVGRDLTRRDMIDILTRAGYSPASAGGRMRLVPPAVHPHRPRPVPTHRPAGQPANVTKHDPVQR